MAVEGFALQAGSYGAEVTRRSMYSPMLQRGASIGSVAGGLIGASDMEITAGTGLHIKVAPGECVIPGSSSATQSGYYLFNSASKEEAIAAASETLPRIDRVSAIVKDQAYSGSESTFTVAVETGTPTSGATLVNLSGVAAAPASSITLGYVEVKAKAVAVSGVSNVASRVKLGPPPLPYKVYGSSATVASGETSLFNASATATLPAGIGSYLTVAAGAGATVKIKGATIYGGFVNAATEITLPPLYSVTLIGIGASEYLIVGGEPKREQTYGAPTARVSGTEYEPSPTRPTLVIAVCTGTEAVFVVGGVTIATVKATAESAVPLTFICPAGVKWKANIVFGAVSTSYLTL